MSKDRLILTVNLGSSSIKFVAYVGKNVEYRANLVNQDLPKIECSSTKTDQYECASQTTEPYEVDYLTLFRKLLSVVKQRTPGLKIDAVGHRIVHGGIEFTKPTLLTPQAIPLLESLSKFAPIHQKLNLTGVNVMRALLPEVPQVGCFDTVFHQTMPLHESVLGLPISYFRMGIKRYGFHGLSYESIVQQLQRIDQHAVTGRTVICHLGAGASLCGLLSGKSVATTMSCTPLDGLLMNTRAGSIDPGVILYLIRNEYKTPDQIERLLMSESGLLGLSGISGDTSVLLRNSSLAAREALDVFCYRIVCGIGSMVAALKGIDAIVFTGGIGENSPHIRATICQHFEWLGISIDHGANNNNVEILHSSGSKVSIFKLSSDENSVIRDHTAETLCT
jgi:acetate kinase